MIERLFELSLGFIWHMIKGELPLSIIIGTLLLGMLFVIVGEWGEHRKLRRMGYIEPNTHRSMNAIIQDALLVITATFVVVGIVYGVFRLGARALPAWGWPVLPEGNMILAWLSLVVVSAALAGVILLELLWGDKPVTLAPFWAVFTLVWAVLSTCTVQWVYPLAGAEPWIYICAGLLSALLSVLLRYLQQMEEDSGESKAEAGAIIVNK